MPRSKIAFACAFAAILLLAPAALADRGEDAVPTAPPTSATVFSDSRLIVEWAPAADHADRVDAREDTDVDFASDLGNRSFQLVEVQPGQTARNAIDELRESPAVVLAERDASVSTNSIPNDPKLGELWGLQNTGLGIDGVSGALAGADVNAPTAWDRTVGTDTTVVADIDSGYRFEHPDLANVAWTNPGETANGLDDDGNGIVDDLHGADFIGNNGDAPGKDGDPTDEDLISGGHGVHTAGTIAAQGNNGVGITGIAQNVRIMPLRVCARFPSAAKSSCLISSIVAAINYAKEKGADVANMSLGGNTGFQSEVNAIAEAKETLFVISAGNDGSDNDGPGSAPHGHHFPCDYTPQTQASPAVPGAIDNIVCVAATNQADGLAGFSDWGATSVDLGAPGTETLSTYPIREFVDETFEANDFGSKWTATGANGGFARTSEAPLTSFGMSDSPGSAPATGSTRESTSAAVAVPAGFSSCTLYQTRTVSLGGGAYTYEVLLNGSFVGGSSPNTSGLFSLSLGNALQGGGNVSLRFRYTAGGSPSGSNGIWLDDIELKCVAPVGQASGYEFLQGTSMAAPHVTGAAGLLFSLKPLATVTEVRNALLTGVDAIPSLSGKTTSGGRLDIAKAMDSLEGIAVDHTAPAAPSLFTEPGSGANNNNPTIKGTAEAGTTATLFEGIACTGVPIATALTPAQLAGAGAGVTVPNNSISFFSAISTDMARNKSACAQTSYLEETPEPEGTVVIGGPLQTTEQEPTPPLRTCTVPKLTGKTLAQAKAALGAAGCKLGTVGAPKPKKGHKPPPLVVKSSAPGAGAKPANGKVNLTLGPKPKPKKRHH